MRYTEFRDIIQGHLQSRRGGQTWAELRDGIDLPYDRPCPTWVQRLEQDIGLTRERGDGRALIWRVPPR